MVNCLIFGADGASLDLIKLWVKEGKLPSFEKIIKGGIIGNLETTIPPLTPCAWSSFMTGKNPGKHGIYDFFYLDANRDMKLNTSKTRRFQDIWEYLSQNGFKNLVFNIPFTYPAKKINGIMATLDQTKRRGVNNYFSEKGLLSYINNSSCFKKEYSTENNKLILYTVISEEGC